VTQREEVWELDQGACVACGRRHLRRASSWQWQAHHVVKEQNLRRLGARPARLRDATYCVLLCRLPCHMNHESRSATITLERLPARVVDAVDALGPAAQDQLRRYHPPAAAGRTPA
jgi:hypothetical protein